MNRRSLPVDNPDPLNTQACFHMPNTQKTLYAVIIGINAYPIRPLAGCVNDAVAIGDYFEKLCRVQPREKGGVNWKPLYLLAPKDAEEEKLLQGKGITYTPPTRANIVNAFAHFKDAKAENGDYCLFYYSGHGSFMTAPDVFADYEPSGHLQTLVCLDSRQPGKRDLLDKELAYLIADTLAGKVPEEDPLTGKMPKDAPMVHFLSIMDCCHSGSNTRGDEPDIVARMQSKGGGLASLNDLEGFTRDGNVLYEKFKPGQTRVTPGTGLKHARYMSLSASRDSELAQEKTMILESIPGGAERTKKRRVRHGVFTYSLLKTLEQSGANLSYAELIRRVEMEVRGLVDRQIPVLSSTRFEDQHQLFLKNEFISPPQQFEVNHRKAFIGKEWYMNAGQLNGIIPPAPGRPTVMKISDGQGGTRLVNVKEVRGNESVLDPAAFTAADEANTLLSATIEQMSFPRISVGMGHRLSQDMEQKLREAWDKRKEQLPYMELIWDRTAPVTFKVRTVQYKDEGETFILTRAESDIPLFIRHATAATFLVDVNKVGKWECTRQIANPDTGIPRDDFEVAVEILEKEPITSQNFAALIQRPWPKKLMDPEIIHARYFGDVQPAIKVSITNKTEWQQYWIGALYLDSHFGITDEWLKVQEIGDDTQRSVKMGFEAGGRRFEAIPLMMNPMYHEYGITEIKDYIIIFISKKDFRLDHYKQESIELNPKRSTGFMDGGVEKEDDWFTIKIPIHIEYPIGKVKLKEGQAAPISRTFHQGSYNKPVENEAMQVQGPTGFSATVQATNLATARRRQEQLKKGKSAKDHERALVPPGSLWMGTEGSEGVFSRNLATSPDNHLSILELTQVQGAIDANHPLRVSPGDPLLEDETIVPFGYDPETDLYFPLGYTDQEGQVVIQQLPPPTDIVIGADDDPDSTDRGLGGSIKLFFHKVVWSKLSGRHDYNTLSWVRTKKNGAFDLVQFQGLEQGADVEARQTIKEALAATTDDILLLIHGFTGDTKAMVRFCCEEAQLHQEFGAVLAFDYENLDTPIEDSAKALKEMLDKVGLQGKRLVLVGSSMGGLVARSFVEDLEGGAALVQKVVQVGSPNAGSELTDLRQKLTGLITLGINGLVFVQPYLPFLSFVWKGVEKRLFRTLEQLEPDSKFLVALNHPSKTPPAIPYYLIAGDTAKIAADYEEADPVWKKIWSSLTQRGKYLLADYAFFDDDPNDMVVKVSSMKALPWGNHQGVENVASDHLSYYRTESARKALKKVLLDQ